MRYETLRELRDAYASGELTPQTATASIDNDQVCVYEHDEEWTDEGTEKVFDMHPEELLEQALDLLGIPHEHV